MRVKKPIFLSSIGAILCLLLPACEQRSSDSQIRDYISSHPEEIVSSVLKFREKMRSQSQKQQRAALERTVHDLISGKNVVINPRQRVHVVEVMDYNCGYCKASFAEIKRRSTSDWKDVEFTFVSLPIISDKSRLADLATRLAVSAKKDSVGFMSELLKKQLVDDSTTIQLASRYSINLTESRKFEGAMQKEMEIIHKFNIKATPTFIVGGKLITGYRPSELDNEINQFRAFPNS